MYGYIRRFEKLGFGMFVHFGIYSALGKGEWALNRLCIPAEKYEKLTKKFKVKKNWAKDLVATAKSAGCKYITLTTRHHDGFSLYDTKGLNTYDAPHSACGRDLVREFVDECNKQGILPFFYHTLIDWHNRDCSENFSKYIDYLIESVELLCTNYGKIGGFWFDGFWDKPDADWQFDRLYSTIRKHQPEAMIINNTGMSNMGTVGHPEIDSVTYERGTPARLGNTDRPVAGEMCQTVNDHWGYCKYDVSYKSIASLILDLINCRNCNCNLLLNVGPMGNGDVRPLDKAIFSEIGKWIRFNKDFIYDARRSDIEAENAIVLKNDRDEYFAVALTPTITCVTHGMLGGRVLDVRINANVRSARWLDNGRKIKVKNNSFAVQPYEYGTSMIYRVAKLELD
ncbi:MAG: alpha-L-fucosidase [Ruminococcaceae bacterium]|nr:alpha-L-fucosidase [Oscillospiraceae bacterium]